jgi:hypothetical protein
VKNSPKSPPEHSVFTEKKDGGSTIRSRIILQKKKGPVITHHGSESALKSTITKDIEPIMYTKRNLLSPKEQVLLKDQGSMSEITESPQPFKL